VLAGVADRIEIWDEELWAEYKKKIEGSAEGMAQTLGDVGLLVDLLKIYMNDIQTLTSVRAKPRLRREEGEALHERKSGPVNTNTSHITVMVKEAIELLDLKKATVLLMHARHGRPQRSYP
jgi:hypothetical protein